MTRTAALPAASAWAVGTWYAAGALTFVAGGGERLGVLPPFWTLAALAAAAWLLVVIARVPLDASRPLYLPLVSLLPWLPAPLPAALMMWVGPLGLALAAAAVVATLWLTWRERRAFSPATAFDLALSRTRAVAFVAGLAALYALAAWRMAPVLPGGDEPHYLIITQSLLNDGDLRIEDNHRRREYLAYVNRDLRPDTRRRGKDREIYSIHAPGVPVLVLPAFAAAGYRGVVAWLSVLSALGALVVWRAARRVAGTPGAAWLATIAIVLSAPYFFQAFTIFPDGPGAVIVIAVVALTALRDRALGVRGAVTAGVLLALLPWLHTRYAILSAALGLVVVGRLLWPGTTSNAEGSSAPRSWRTRLPLVAAFAAPAVVGAFLWLYYFKAIYGVWDPRVPYGFVPQVSLARIPQGLAGLFVDQQFGLLPHAPIYIVAVIGFGALWRRSRRLVLELALVVVPYVLTVSGFTMWWGGHSSPVRFLVAVLPLMALPLAAWWQSPRSRAAKTVAALLLGVSLTLTGVLAFVDRGALVYNWRDGHALWALAASRAVNLTLALPSFFQTDVAGMVRLAAILAVVGAAGFVILVLFERLQLRPGAWALATGLCTVTVITGGAAAGWATTGHDPRDYGTGAVWVAGRACEGGLRAYWTRSLRVQDTRDAITTLTVPDASRRIRREDSPLWTARDVPPGRYRIAAAATEDVELQVKVRRPDAAPIAVCRPHAPSGSNRCEFDLPAGAVELIIDTVPTARSRIDTLTLHPVAPGPAVDCDLRAAGAAVTEAGALYLVGGRGYVHPWGVWTASGARVTVVPSGPKMPSTRLRIGVAAPGRVVVSSGAWRQEKQLAPGETWEVDVPARPYASGVQRIDIWTDAAFRPSDANPESRDHRLLGARVAR